MRCGSCGSKEIISIEGTYTIRTVLITWLSLCKIIDFRHQIRVKGPKTVLKCQTQLYGVLQSEDRGNPRTTDTVKETKLLEPSNLLYRKLNYSGKFVERGICKSYLVIGIKKGDLILFQNLQSTKHPYQILKSRLTRYFKKDVKRKRNFIKEFTELEFQSHI